MDDMLIITQVPGNIQNFNFVTGEFRSYMPEARIVALDPDKPKSLKVLSEDFYSACSPEISYDGKYMLFAAQQKQGEPWQIWEMKLKNSKSRKITSFQENCTDPVYLPIGRLVFSKMTVNDTIKTGHSLYVCNLDGSDVRQITFHPHANFATTVLRDGRLLTISRQLLPEQKDPMFMVLRPDGTKADIFYKDTEGAVIVSCGRETPDGKIMFIETDKNNLTTGDIVSINYNRPLHTRVNLTSGIIGDFCSVLPLQSGNLLVSYRKSDTDLFALYEFDPVKKVLSQAIYSNPDFHIMEVLVAEKYNRPKKLPSEVDMGVKTGLLLCQDINFTDKNLTVNDTAFPKAHKIEVLGIDTAYGIVKVENDGSFQLKVLADKPFQIQTLDKHGRVVNGPCAWLWLRPNERRGCVGCHENPEMVPENNVPLAVKKPPVIIPVHISEVNEKEVELE
jgi:hypothetical protein